MFKLYIEHTAQSYINHTSSIIQALLYSKLSRILDGGITNLFPGIVRLDNGAKTFKVRIDAEVSGDVLVSGLVLVGRFDKTKEGLVAYYIENVRGLKGGKTIGPTWANKESGVYTEITHNFIDQAVCTPFLKKGAKDLGSRAKSFVNYHRMRSLFYPDCRSVQAFKAHHELYGSFLDHRTFSLETKETHFLGGSKVGEGSSNQSIKALVDEAKKKFKNPYIIINFIDYQDDLWPAQTEFFKQLSACLRCSYSDVDIVIIDVNVRDEEGNCFFQSEYQDYRKRAPQAWELEEETQAFSVVLFSPLNTLLYSQDVHEIRNMNFKTFFIDLFQGCRSEGLSNHELDGRYQKNLDVITHELFAAAGAMLSAIGIDVKDLRRYESGEVEATCKMLAEHSIVIRVNGNEELPSMIKEVSALLQTTGYPYMVVVKADQNESGVSLYSRSFSIACAYDLRDIHTKAVILYEHNILALLPGNQTVNNLYSGYDFKMDERVLESIDALKHSPTLLPNDYREGH